MTLEEMKAKAATIKEEINTILGEITSKDGIEGAINWADLGCVEVGVSLTDEPMVWYAVVEEASPSAFRLSEHIHTELQRLGFDVWVRTEW